MAQVSCSYPIPNTLTLTLPEYTAYFLTLIMLAISSGKLLNEDPKKS